jgi:LysR family nitrogen assimilation transcriptional regulator
MNIDDLRLLLKVAESGNLSRAADALGLTQPSVSRRLRELENQFESPLFYRTGRGVKATEIGEVAISKAQTLVLDFDNYVSEIKETALGPSGVVSIALLTAYMREFAVDLFELVKHQHPRIMLRMVESFSVQHEEWLANGQVDIALVTQYHNQRASHEDTVSSSNLALIGAKHLLPNSGRLPFSKLDGMDLVLPSPMNGLRQRVEEEAAKQKIRFRVIFEADSLEAQLALIRRYPCCAVHNEFAVCTITDPSLPRFVVLRTTTHHPLSWATRVVAHLLRQLIDQAHCQTHATTSKSRRFAE